MNDVQFGRFKELVHDLTGVTILDTRRSMLASRIGSRMRATGMDDFDAYRTFVIEDATERALFVDKVTTHETYFFRTPRVWQYLEETYLPAWREGHPNAPCRVWSAAASSGEEPYSLAIALHTFAAAHPPFKYSVEASDISEVMIDKCRAGNYEGRSVSRFSAARPVQFQKYLLPQGSGYEIAPTIKGTVNFFPHNLFTKATRGPYDLVLLRNVLIYFDLEDQARVLRNIRRAMRDDGVLIIGESESIGMLGCGFSDVEPFVYKTTPSVLGAAANG